MKQAVRTLFHEMVGMTTEERERIYRERTIDESMRAEVESLLRFDSTSSPLTGDPVDRVIGDVLRRLDEGEEITCGPYRLIRRIGRGGMGAVYLGERVDGELRQQAAVKLLRADADFDAWRPHFLRERQMLADLNHPAIARLLDAGHTADGRPYLVMEYVDGLPVDAYAQDLDLAARLRLFLQVCEGVSHAHRRLVIHRDLKPSNIMVDATGAVKLLDFGIARLVGAGEPATQTIDRFLTPEYASPEQWRGAAQTTATDVYSLGAVLCRLLTGEPRLAGEATLPSDVLFIVRKAMREEPEERYGSVDAMASDVTAYLENRPVAARAGDRWYRVRKFVRRHWIPVSAAAAILIAVGAAFWAVNRERAIAEQRFEEVRQLAGKLFEIDRQVRGLPGAAKARQYIVETSLDYLRRLDRGVKGDPELALDLGTAYWRVGRVQGVPVTPNLGDAEAAERSLQSAEKLIGEVLAAEPGNRTAQIRAAQIAHDRMILAQGRHPNTEALGLARRSNEWLQKYLASGAVQEAEKDQVMIAGMNVANWLSIEHQFDESLALLRQTIEIGRRTNQEGQVAATHIALARTLRRMGDLDGALEAIRESVRILERAPSSATSPTLGVALSTEGDILGQDGGVSLGRPREAAAIYERAFRLATEAARRDPANAMALIASASRGRKLADVVRRWDARSAVGVYDEALGGLAGIKNNPKVRRDEVGLFAGSAVALAGMGRGAEARARLAAAFERLRELKMYPSDELEGEALDALLAQADVEPGRAIAIYEEVLRKVKAETATSLDDANDVARVYEGLAAAYRRAGRVAEASEVEGRRRELWLGWERNLPGNAFVRRQLR